MKINEIKNREKSKRPKLFFEIRKTVKPLARLVREEKRVHATDK